MQVAETEYQDRLQITQYGDGKNHQMVIFSVMAAPTSTGTHTHTHDTNFLRAQELPYQIQLISRTCLTKISFDKALNSSSVAPAGASTAVAAKRRHLGRRGTFLSDELSVYIVFGGLRQAVCYAPLVVTKSLV